MNPMTYVQFVPQETKDSVSAYSAGLKYYGHTAFDFSRQLSKDNLMTQAYKCRLVRIQAK